MAKSEGNTIEYTADDPMTLMAVLIDEKATEGVKEAALRRLRELERRDGRVYYGNYNGKETN